MFARAPLLALLVYVTLDLSLPAMPGAFTFDAGDSVESLQGARSRTVADHVAHAPRVNATSTGALSRSDLVEASGRTATLVRHSRRVRAALPRIGLASASRAPASVADDPH